MPYLTGGFAYGGVSNNSLSNMIAGQTTSVIDSQIRTANGGINSSVQTGWAAGTGAELIVAENWSIRGEYLFTQLGSFSSNSNGFSSYSSTYYVSALTSYNSSSTGIRWNQSSLGPIGFHQVRVGLNYHTDWLKELPVSLR
jgi:outer membrane immunogenic protein